MNRDEIATETTEQATPARDIWAELEAVGACGPEGYLAPF